MIEKYLVTAVRYGNGKEERVFVKGTSRQSYHDMYERMQQELKQYTNVKEYGKVFKWNGKEFKEYKPKKENEK